MSREEPDDVYFGRERGGDGGAGAAEQERGADQRFRAALAAAAAHDSGKPLVLDGLSSEEVELAQRFMQQRAVGDFNGTEWEVVLLLYKHVPRRVCPTVMVPQTPANTVTDISELFDIKKNVEATASETTLCALSMLGSTPMDAVLKCSELVTLIDRYVALLRELCRGLGPEDDDAEALDIPEELSVTPEFKAAMHVVVWFRVFKKKWKLSFGKEGGVDVQVTLQLASRAGTNEEQAGSAATAASGVDDSYDQEAGALDQPCRAQDMLHVPLSVEGEHVGVAPGMYLQMPDGSTLYNSHVVPGKPLIRVSEEELFRVCGDDEVPVLRVRAPGGLAGKDVFAFLARTPNIAENSYGNGSAGTGPGQFYYLRGVAVDYDTGRLFAGERSVGQQVRVIKLADGSHDSWIPAQGRGACQGIARDFDTGILVLPCESSQQLFMFDRAGALLRTVKHADTGFSGTVSIGMFGDQKAVYAACYSKQCVTAFDLEGNHLQTIKHGLNAYGMGVSPDGLVYVSTFSNPGVVEVYTQQGEHVKQFASGLKSPWGISFNSKGYVAVGSSNNPGHITVFSPEGDVVHTGRDCNCPSGVTWYNDHQLLVSIFYEHKLELITVPNLPQ